LGPGWSDEGNFPANFLDGFSEKTIWQNKFLLLFNLKTDISDLVAVSYGHFCNFDSQLEKPKKNPGGPFRTPFTKPDNHPPETGKPVCLFQPCEIYVTFFSNRVRLIKVCASTFSRPKLLALAEKYFKEIW